MQGCKFKSLVIQATIFCTGSPNIFSIIIAIFPYIQKCVSVHTKRAESVRQQ